MRRFTILSLMAVLLLCGCLFAGEQTDEFETNAGWVVGVGGTDLRNVRIETAIGVEVTSRLVIEGRLGTSKEGQSRGGFGAAVKIFNTKNSSMYIMGDWNAEEETVYQKTGYAEADSLLSESMQWNMDKALWGMAFYYKPFNLGLYARRNDDLKSDNDQWEFFVFYWVEVDIWPF